MSVDVFRSSYRPLSIADQDHIGEIKEKAGELYELLYGLHEREFALARTKLEESVMWATKAVTG